jgi:GTPase
MLKNDSGNVDAGKSTLLGVFTHGDLDNGRGFARQKLFRHMYEAEQTSNVGLTALGLWFTSLTMAAAAWTGSRCVVCE